MKEKAVHVECPETENAQIIEVSADGEIAWCTRVLNKPECDGKCLPRIKVSVTENPGSEPLQL